MAVWWETEDEEGGGRGPKAGGGEVYSVVAGMIIHD